MPDLLEHVFCAQQINIPPNLPYILKQYAKAAIRTQPYDLLYWSAAYFKAKANNLPPPVKERLEYPPFDSPSRLSPGFLRVLHKQLGEQEYVRVEVLYEKWLGVCLVKEALDSMLKIGSIQDRVPWLKFVAIAAGHICSSLGKTMVLICEILTDQPDGSAAWIPVDKFVELYQFLARLNCGPDPPKDNHVELVLETPSATTTQDSSVVTEDKEEIKDEAKEFGEKDSTAGLMVWPDVKPQEKPDRVRTPKAEDEPGATSELGLEVLDDAKGPDKQLVTLFPATTTKSEESEHYESKTTTGAKPHQSESVHESFSTDSSFIVNKEWKKIPAKNLDDVGRESDEPLDLDKLISSSPSKSGAKEEGKTENGEAEEPKENKDNVAEDPESQHDTKVKPSEEEITDRASKAEQLHEKEVSGDGSTSQIVQTSQEKSDENVESLKTQSTFDSTDTEYAVEQSITVANFIKQKRETDYSVVEIRKGRFGDKSMDLIDRGDQPLSSATKQRLSFESEESVETQEEEANLPYWCYVPGIGPVIPEAQILAVVEYMQYWATKQQGMVGPRNINHLLCPPLDLPPPTEEDVVGY